MAVTSSASGERVLWMIPGPGPDQVPTTRVGNSPASTIHTFDSRTDQRGKHFQGQTHSVRTEGQAMDENMLRVWSHAGGRMLYL